MAIHETWLGLGPRDANADPAVLMALLETQPDIEGPDVVVTATPTGRALLASRIERGLKRRWRGRLAGREPSTAQRPVPHGARLGILLALLPALLAGSVVASAALDRPATTLHDEKIVHAPRQLVWKLLIDFDAYDSWNPYITDAHGAARRGAQLVMRLRPRGESARKMDCEVVTVKHLRKLSWRCRDHAIPGLLDREHVFRVLPVDSEGTRVRVVYDGRWEGVLVPFTELGNRKAGYVRMILALKERAEALG